MSEKTKVAGSITWTDLTVKDAESIRDFYHTVVGWNPAPVAMGDYNDFSMTTPAESKAVAGICHARGDNADLPAQWLIYITVADLKKSLERCTALGGKIIASTKNMGSQGSFAVIQDPAGAVAALFEPAAV